MLAEFIATQKSKTVLDLLLLAFTINILYLSMLTRV